VEEQSVPSPVEVVREETLAGRVLHESRLPRPFSGEEAEKVAFLEGKKGRYYFIPDAMSLSYASLMVRLEEEDYLKMIAEMVRSESRLYPRTTPVAFFLDSPYALGQETLDEVLSLLDTLEEYDDIRRCTASNGAVHLFSITCLDAAQAEYLCEWEEVGRIENQ
jgi:hypothetical protein